MKKLKWALVAVAVVVASVAGASASVWVDPDPTSVPPTKFSQPAAVRTSLSGSIDERVLNTMMVMEQSAFDSCYTEFVRKNPGVSGTVVLHFAVEPDGRVGEACQSRGTTLPMEVGLCITNHVQWMQFPMPFDLQNVAVEYRFEFVPPPGNS